ncbi:hypothetical protein ACFPRL_20305 [Pseudoclavibacter helvolus]
MPRSLASNSCAHSRLNEGTFHEKAVGHGHSCFSRPRAHVHEPRLPLGRFGVVAEQLPQLREGHLRERVATDPAAAISRVTEYLIERRERLRADHQVAIGRVARGEPLENQLRRDLLRKRVVRVRQHCLAQSRSALEVGEDDKRAAPTQGRLELEQPTRGVCDVDRGQFGLRELRMLRREGRERAAAPVE